MPAPTHPGDPTRQGLRRSAWAFALCAAALLVAGLMQVGTDGARLLGVEGGHCALGDVLGEQACPGCGLTRSTALSVQGRIGEALRLNAAGPLIVLLCLGGLLVHGHALLSRHRSSRHNAVLRVGHIVFVLGLVAAWILRATRSA